MLSMPKIVMISILVLIGIMLVIGSCSIVKPGHRGVRVTMGKVSDVPLEEGIHLKLPMFQKVVPVEVRVSQIEYENLAAASSSMQDVFSNVAISFHIQPEKTPIYFKQFGKDQFRVMEVIVSAKLQEIVKATTNMYTTEELLSKRSAIRDSIYVKLIKVATKHYVIIDEFSMTNFRFGVQYQAAIEEKQVMEQRALTAQRTKEVAQQEGEAKIISAKAEAESNKLRQISLTPELIRYEEVMVLKEKWDGALPQVTSGAIPMINLGK